MILRRSCHGVAVLDICIFFSEERVQSRNVQVDNVMLCRRRIAYRCIH
jgi:hypothetical protein